MDNYKMPGDIESVSVELRMRRAAREFVSHVFLNTAEVKQFVEDSMNETLAGFNFNAALRDSINKAIQQEVKEGMERIVRQAMWDEELSKSIRGALVRAIQRGETNAEDTSRR
jgi:hypothetical protein